MKGKFFLIAAICLALGGGMPGAWQQMETIFPNWFIPSAGAQETNLARGKAVQQSSTDYGGDPRRAVDGNIDGNWGSNSVSHTAGQPQPWWQVDLGASQSIRTIRIWNRTDCCAERLADFYVFVSDNPFSSAAPNSTVSQPGVWHYYHKGVAGRTTDIPVNRNGRYVRVQLTGANYLQLAEVEVLGAGWPGLPPQAGSSGVQVQVVGYGRDESDGSGVSWNSQYPNPSFDDDPNRKGLPNARWQGAHRWEGDRLCLDIKNLEAPYPPAHTLSVGYTVSLQGGTFEDGSTSKTVVMYRYSGVPAEKNMSQCLRVIGGGGGSSITGRSYTGARPRPPAVSADLTGRWRCNDGGTYYLRQVGNQLWWYGQSGDGGNSWSNVLSGQIEGGQVSGRWADVPHGRIMGSGEMTLQIVAPNLLRAINRTGGFGGSEWTR